MRRRRQRPAGQNKHNQLLLRLSTSRIIAFFLVVVVVILPYSEAAAAFFLASPSSRSVLLPSEDSSLLQQFPAKKRRIIHHHHHHHHHSSTSSSKTRLFDSSTHHHREQQRDEAAAAASPNNNTNNTTRMKVCIIGGGNAAHALAALFPHYGHETTMFCPYQDQAERIRAGMMEQQNGGEGFMMEANFAPHNVNPSGLIQGAPKVVSKHARDVIPDADVIVMPLPSFTYESTLHQIKPHLQPGQVVIVTPGQGGFDWYARQILGEELFSSIIFCGLMPMPFNCRITKYGRRVEVQEFKKKYSIGVSPRSALPYCQNEIIPKLFGAGGGGGDSSSSPSSLVVEPAGSGSFLECTMYPINAIIHPARLYTLLADYNPQDKRTWLTENPYFYEDLTDEAAAMMDAINQELILIGEALATQQVSIGRIPHIFDWLAVYVYDEPPDSNLKRFFSTNEAYKGFRCPLVEKKMESKSNDNDNGVTTTTTTTTYYVPDFTNRYFTEDINLGLVGYKGLADIAGNNIETPVMDKIIAWAQQGMGNKEFLDVKTGRLMMGRRGGDLSITNAPQRFGISTMEDLRRLYPITTAAAAAAAAASATSSVQ